VRTGADAGQLTRRETQRGSILPTFTADASAGLAGPEWLRRRRSTGFEAFSSSPLPSESEEVWRYTPIDHLDLDQVGLPPLSRALSPRSGASEADQPADARAARTLLAEVAASLGSLAGTALVVDGRVLSLDLDEAGRRAGLTVGSAHDVPGAADMLGSVLDGGDALVRLNDAFVPDPLFIDVPAQTAFERPLLVLHWVTGGAAVFPRLTVRAGPGARASVVEVFAGAPAPAPVPTDATDAAEQPPPTLVVPVTELAAEAEASLAYVSVQVLGSATWCVARLAARGDAASTLRTFTVGLGAIYDRVRADVTAAGRGARSEILSTYLGDGGQVHDVRTLQDHAAPRTTSELLCQGAVAGRSRSVYSGLIRVHRGAVRSDARQTNHNLVLDEGAHADSVPNLDILENDVTCSHASTVGPIDEDQRYYIESRGVPPEVAEGIIVRGFFDAVIERAPVPEVTALLEHEIHRRLDGAMSREHAAPTEDPGATGA
jgi:Fe-S cluster assembly protein SufD